jgi:hypothetical protein
MSYTKGHIVFGKLAFHINGGAGPRAGPLACTGRPRPALFFEESGACHRRRAGQGAGSGRPTVDANGRNLENYVALGLQPAPLTRGEFLGLRSTMPSRHEAGVMRAQFVSGRSRVDGGLERPPAGTIACPTTLPTAHLGIAKAQRRPFRPPSTPNRPLTQLARYFSPASCPASRTLGAGADQVVLIATN